MPSYVYLGLTDAQKTQKIEEGLAELQKRSRGFVAASPKDPAKRELQGRALEKRKPEIEEEVETQDISKMVGAIRFMKGEPVNIDKDHKLYKKCETFVKLGVFEKAAKVTVGAAKTEAKKRGRPPKASRAEA